MRHEGRLVDIHEYLLDPHKIGVYFCRFDIKIGDVIKLLEKAVGFDKAEKREPETYNTLRFIDHELNEDRHPWLFRDFKEVLDHLDIYKPENPPLGPWKLKKPFKEVLTEKELRWISVLQDDYRSMMTRYPSPSSFLESYQAAVDAENAINLDVQTAKDVLRLNLYSLKEQGIRDHAEFLKSISLIGKKIEVSKMFHKFSSRYCYRVYPSALVVWLCKVADNPIPTDILQYFIGAARYYEQKEWRVSIVLSAIAVETILAELYEELKHQPAPPDTLGSLFSQVSNLVKIPTEIKADVEEVNNNRILSVHRSSMNLEDKEARASLVGATRFTHWAYFYGPFSM
jgi:HEPN domain-containing protein